jgi:ferric-dicitrate binding protein FerR (iron transport regulator)
VDDSHPSNARADGLDELTAGLATFVAAQAERGAAAAGAQTSAVDGIGDGLAARARRQVVRRRFALGASVGFVAVAAVAGLSARRLAERPAAALSYTVDGALPPAGGYVRSSTEHQPLLAFSDGTRIQMTTGARARVLEVDRRGARVVLEQGRAHVEVVHRPGAEWRFEAGEFLIHVHGTAFFVEWNPEQARLDVRMENGVVSVDGPRRGESVVLRAGQSLSVSVRKDPAPRPAARPDPAPAGSPPRAAAPELAPRAGTAPPVVTAGWPERLAEGQAAAIVAEAERRGIARVLARGSSEDLAALADAARYERKDGLARRALLVQRRRFPRSARAEEASFLLGRLDDDRATGNPDAALSWYDRYLRDAPRGTYAAEALGRKMMVLQREHRAPEARAIAVDYLRRFPDGTYAHAARALGPSSP